MSKPESKHPDVIDEPRVHSPGRRARRTRDEITHAILEVAAEQFASRGLSGTRMLDIAEGAQVSTRTLYQYFRSKEELFVAASVEPFIEFAKEWKTVWARQKYEDASDYDISDAYVRTMYAHVKRHLPSVRAVFVATNDPDATEMAERARREFAKVLKSLELPGVEWANLRGHDLMDVRLRVHVTVSTVVTAATLGEWFYDAFDARREERMLRVIVDSVARSNSPW